MAPSPTVIYYANGSYGNCTEVYCRFETYFPDREWGGTTVESLYSGDLPTKEGYIFSGWQYENNGVDVSDSLVNDVVDFGTFAYFQPIWAIAAPTITFNANSGTFPTSGETQSIYNSTELTGSTTLSSIVEMPTKPGYVFQGWSTTSTGSVQYTQASKPTISSDTMLYAIYEPDTTKVVLEKGAVDIILGKLKR